MKRFLVFISIIVGAFNCSEYNDNLIKIFPKEVISKDFIGFGVQWDPYPHADTEKAEWGKLMTDEKWEMVFKRLDYMKPRIVRVLGQANWRYLDGFTKDGVPIINYDSEEEKVLEMLLGYCQKNDITVMLGEWGCPYKVHDTDAGFSNVLKGANDPVWIDMIVKHLEHLIIDKGLTCIKYFNLVNEPNGDWASTDGNWEEWSSGVKLLSEKLVSKGMDAYVSIAGPDAVAHFDHRTEKPGGMGWVEQTAIQLNNKIGALELHAYFDLPIIREEKFEEIYAPLARIAKSVNKPIIFGEVGYEKATPENQKRVQETPCTSPDSYLGIYDFQHGIDVADAAIQIINTGFNGAAAWALDDAMHTLNDSGDKNQLKRWGMWNSLGTELCNNPEDESIRPWFFTWSLLCRYIQPGSEIIKTQKPSVKGFRLAVAKKGDDYTIIMINQADKKVGYRFEDSYFLNDLKFKEYHYQENNYKVDPNSFPVPVRNDINLIKTKGGFEIPAHSCKIFTTYKY